MNFSEFDFQMKRVVDAFDKSKSFYGKERCDVIFASCQDLDARDFQRLVTDMIMRLKDRPVPDDFAKVAAGYRKHYPRPQVVEDGEVLPDCRHCKDVGFIRVREHEDTEMRTASLMRCICPTGTRHPEHFIPTWERGLEQAFTWAPCPVEWFKPVDFAPGSDGVTYESLLGILELWKKRLKRADEYWKNRSKQEIGA